MKTPRVHLSSQVSTAFVPLAFLLFLSLSYVQTLVFLAKNRKPYQIGITVLRAAVYFPQRRDEFEPRQKAICCVRTDLFRARKSTGGRREALAHAFLKQRAVACELDALDKG